MLKTPVSQVLSSETFFSSHENYLAWIPRITLAKWSWWDQRWDLLNHPAETLSVCTVERLRIVPHDSWRFLICLLVNSLLTPILMGYLGYQVVPTLTKKTRWKKGGKKGYFQSV